MSISLSERITSSDLKISLQFNYNHIPSTKYIYYTFVSHMSFTRRIFIPRVIS